MNILIVGGNGGIGSALVRHSLEAYPQAMCLATYHRQRPDLTHPRLDWVRLDVQQEADIQALSQRLQRIHLLINAVGFLHQDDQLPEKSIQALDTDFFRHNLALNTLPSLLLAKHCQAALRQAGAAHFVALSARIGSIADNRLGGWISYRAAKAALNMTLKTLSIEWQRTTPACCVLAFHPGTTDTPLSRPFQRQVPALQLQTPAATARHLLALVQRTDAQHTGRFYAFDGSELPW